MPQLQRLLPEFKAQAAQSLATMTNLFINKLKLHHFKNGILDLHGLDYLSVSLLLNEGFKTSADLKKIIFGAASHSKAAHKTTMKCLVETYLKERAIIGVIWDKGAVQISASSLNTKPSLFKDKKHLDYKAAILMNCIKTRVLNSLIRKLISLN